MDFIIYLAWYGLLAVVGIGAFLIAISAIGNKMAKRNKSQAVLNKSGRGDIRVDK